MSYDKEVKLAEKAARKACPIAFQLFDTLEALDGALWREFVEHGPDAEKARRMHDVSAAWADIAATCAEVQRATFEGHRPPADISELQARMALERVGLLPIPDLVTVCACGNEIAPCAACERGEATQRSPHRHHECAAQRRYNRISA